ncbi:MAG: hypothetical protein KKH61_21620 [Gammaproteobacteria bacterium]|nr:hypothetical protein [Gammaproteobacteria bacterium]
MAIKEKAQISMDDKIVHDDELEELLETRQSLKKEVAEFRKVDKEARQKIGTVGVETPFRCVRFIIAESMTQPGHVEFDKLGGSRVQIKTADE